MAAIPRGKCSRWGGAIRLAGIVGMCLGPALTRAGEPPVQTEALPFLASSPGFEKIGPATESVDQEARINELERQLAELRDAMGQRTNTSDADDDSLLQFVEPTSLMQANVPPLPGAPNSAALTGPAQVKYPVINVSGLMQADAVFFEQDAASTAALGNLEWSIYL